MSEQRYFFNNNADEEEFKRLKGQEVAADPVTFRRLESQGVREGWKCLEVGAGTGSVAEWLANRVGQKGKVVATDINIRFLRRLSLSNLEIRQHDIVKDELEANKFDLVHCRFVLQHVSDPETALKHIANSVSPGGLLLIEEPDRGSIRGDLNHPSAPFFTNTLRTFYDNVSSLGRGDSYFGCRLGSLVGICLLENTVIKS